MSKIEWTDETWNPIIGCSKISAGCDNCYAEKMASRLASMGTQGYSCVIQAVRGQGHSAWNNKTSLVESALDKPMFWKKPRKVFVCSMGDLFHESVPFEWIDKALAMAALCPQHTFQCLSKRPKIMQNYFKKALLRSGSVESEPPQTTRKQTPENISNGITSNRNAKTATSGNDGQRHSEAIQNDNKSNIGNMHPPDMETHLNWPLPNLWLGVTCENQATANERIPLLLQCPAAVRFVSVEPMLEEINIPRQWLQSLDWVICGGESGPKARPMSPDWARDLRDQCKEAGVAFFMKQMSGRTKAERQNIPADLMIREFPKA